MSNLFNRSTCITVVANGAVAAILTSAGFHDVVPLLLVAVAVAAAISVATYTGKPRS